MPTKRGFNILRNLQHIDPPAPSPSASPTYPPNFHGLPPGLRPPAGTAGPWRAPPLWRGSLSAPPPGRSPGNRIGGSHDLRHTEKICLRKPVAYPPNHIQTRMKFLQASTFPDSPFEWVPLNMQWGQRAADLATSSYSAKTATGFGRISSHTCRVP